MRDPKSSGEGADEIAEWDGGSASHALIVAPRRTLRERVGKRVDAALSSALQLLARRLPAAPGDARADAAPLARTGGSVARWLSFPRGVRLATAATATAAAGLAAWGVLAFAGN